MSFPAGGLPDQGTVSNQFRPYRTYSYAGGSSVDLTDPAQGLGGFATEFVCTTAGNLVVLHSGDTSSPGFATTNKRTVALNAGDVFYGVFVYVDTSSTAVGLFRR